jgi:hypothetical protein
VRNTRIRTSESSMQVLRELSTLTGKSVSAVLETAIEQYRRLLILEETNAAYAKLRADPEAWQGVEEERAEWDLAFGDGLSEL